jgi:hypothetical protein
MPTKSQLKPFLFLAVVFVLGYLDWLTTVAGLLFHGGVELNPLLSGLTSTSMLYFSTVKLVAVAIAAFAAYKAAEFTKYAKGKRHLMNRMVSGSFLLTTLFLAVVVTNNMTVIFSF